MPRKIQNCTKQSLINVPLPDHADSYTVISHELIMDMSAATLSKAGFTVESEEYRATADGNIAQGIYKLNYNSDPELSMMFAWTNSYNKQVRFKCGIGAYINNTDTVMVAADMGSWTRKHTGTADEETLNMIAEQVSNAQLYYNQLVMDKESMKNIKMTKRRQAQMLGILFAEYQILTTEQASLVRQQMDKPMNVFEDVESLWAFYNFVTNALAASHPRTWMEDQRILHYFISTINNFEQPVPVPLVVAASEEEVDPNQISLLDQIAEIEAEEESSQLITEDFSVMLTDETVVEYEIASDSTIESITITEDEIRDVPMDEVIHYTDPVGNTFEAPVVPPCVGHDAETEKELEDELFDLDLSTATDSDDDDEGEFIF